MRSTFVLFILFLALVSILSEALSPATTPEQVILSQLTALQQDDMSGVYEFASPVNKQRTGDVNTFGQMVRSGPYRYLIHHKRADILMASTIAASKQYLVRVFPDDSIPTSSAKKVVEYWWSLSRCKTGPNAGCYMVDAVIPNL